MRENYIDLCCFNFGKRCYVIMKNSIKIMFFEKVNNNYEMPILSFNLYDNVGKSLTVVNQNFFLSQLINRLNIAFNKGIFSNDKELKDYLYNIKSKVENDIYLKKLFKGSFMNVINEESFESNKREIIKYLDGFKIDMFVNYNNVSFFNGSIEKGNTTDINVPTFSLETEENSDVVDDNSIENVFLDDDVSSAGFVNSQSTDVEETNVVDSNDYFNSLNSNQDVSSVNSLSQSKASVQNNISYVDEVRKRLENNF